MSKLERAASLLEQAAEQLQQAQQERLVLAAQADVLAVFRAVCGLDSQADAVASQPDLVVYLRKEAADLRNGRRVNKAPTPADDEQAKADAEAEAAVDELHRRYRGLADPGGLLNGSEGDAARLDRLRSEPEHRGHWYGQPDVVWHNSQTTLQDKLRQAAGRAYCAPANVGKATDHALLNAVVHELMEALRPDAPVDIRLPIVARIHP